MKRVPGSGFRIQSSKGWFYLGLAGHIYTFHLELGRFCIVHQNKDTRRKR